MRKRFSKSWFGIWLTILLASSTSWAGINFDNVDDLASINDFTVGTSDFTFSIWFKPDVTFNSSSTDSQVLFGKYENTNEMFVVVLAGTDNTSPAPVNYGELYIKKEQAGGQTPGTRTVYISTTTNSWTANTWYHILVTFDKDGSSQWDEYLYVNGTQEASDTTTHGSAEGLDTIAASYNIGFTTVEQSGGGSEYFDGDIAEVALWNVILTSQEISMLALSKVKGMPLQIQPGNLKAYWPLDGEEDGSSADADTFLDKSGNGNTCTGNDGANNTGLTAIAEAVLSYP